HLVAAGPKANELADYHREGDRAAPAVAVDGANAELHVVLGDVERDAGDVADLDHVGPVRHRGLPHHDLVPSDVGLGVGVPLERGQVGAGEVDRWVRVNLHALGGAGVGGQRPYRGEVDRGDPGHEVEVNKVDQVAQLHAVDHLDVLVLVVEVLSRLGEPSRRVTQSLERDMVTGPQVPVATPDRPHVH